MLKILTVIAIYSIASLQAIDKASKKTLFIFSFLFILFLKQNKFCIMLKEWNFATRAITNKYLKKTESIFIKMYTQCMGEEKLKGLEKVGKRYERRDSFKFTHGDVLGSVSALANTSSYRQD